jgi:hypothetical protein
MKAPSSNAESLRGQQATQVRASNGLFVAAHELRDLECRHQTDMARRRAAELYGPMAREGARLLEAYRTQELAGISKFLEDGSALQRVHAARIRQPSSASGRRRFVHNRSRPPSSRAAIVMANEFVVYRYTRRVYLAMSAPDLRPERRVIRSFADETSEP